VPSDSIVDQLLLLDDEELAIPLSDGPASINHAISQILQADLLLDDFANLATNEEHNPQTICQAEHSKHWNKWLTAMFKVLEVLKVKEVYEEVDELSPGRKAMQCKWVLHIKCDKEGQISRFKGCSIAKGFTQIFGQDFTFTFAPVAHWDSIQTILCIAILNDYEL
jgi:Reverse transcriptase (RNA-dependent DNA polymerase)